MTEPLYHDCPDDLAEDVPDHARAHLAYIEDYLDQPFHGFGTVQVLDPHFGVVALGHMAGGMMNMARAIDLPYSALPGSLYC